MPLTGIDLDLHRSSTLIRAPALADEIAAVHNCAWFPHKKSVWSEPMLSRTCNACFLIGPMPP